MNLLQTQNLDLSWLPLLGEIGVAAFFFTVMVVVFIKFGWPKYLDYRVKVEEIKATASKGALAEEMSGRLGKIEEALSEDIYNWKKIQVEVDKRFDIIESILADHEQFSSKISEGTLVNQLFNDSLWVFLRLKSFRRLLAMRKNGRIWEKGLKLILEHKEIWLDVLETELGIPMVDKAYYYGRLDEIRRRIYDDFSGNREGL